NYLNRYHARHVDLMDVLSGYQARGRASLEHAALLLGLPGKLGMGGDQVFEFWRAGRVAEIRAYCETDVLNTYLIWLRFQLVRGLLAPAQHVVETARVRAWLAERAEPHWRQYDAAWARD
ncbi:MAG: 3'-5' exonuclease, partial [Steroidobacteraceae bacterium]